MTARGLRYEGGADSRIRELAGSAYPNEGCGVLIGRVDDEGVVIVEATSARNLVTNRAHDRYELDPVDFVRADASARERGLDVVGFWHSHPDHPARPSRFDSERAWPDYVYVICRTTATGAEEMAAFGVPAAGGPLLPLSVNGTGPESALPPG